MSKFNIPKNDKIFIKCGQYWRCTSSMCEKSWLRVGGGGSLQRNQRPLPLIYTTPTNLHNLNPDVGQARFRLVPRRWIDPDPDLTLHVTVSIQCRANVVPELHMCAGLVLDRLGSLVMRINY